MEDRIKKSTFKRQWLSLKANVQEQIVFQETKPNVFFIENRSDSAIKMSVNSNPDVQPLLTINGGERRSHIEILGSNTLYLISTGNVNYLLESFEMDNISPADIPETSVVAFSDAPTINVGAVTAIEDSLPAGTNVIGNVGLAAGNNNIGNVDIVTLPALPAGNNNIGDVDVVTLPALPAGDNNIGNVDIVTMPAVTLNSLPAGSNTIGTVSVNTQPSVALNLPDIYNVTMTNADTEYSQILPAQTKKLSLMVIDGDSTKNYRLAFVTGKVATPTAPYLKAPCNFPYSVDNIKIASGTVYFACSEAGKVMSIECWT